MALPIAQLGYSPNINLNNRIPRPILPVSPWEQMAAQLLGRVGGDLASNALSPDYTAQANKEGLIQPVTTSIGGTSAGSDGQSTTPAASSTMAEPSFWSRLWHGPQVTGQMYGTMRQQKQQQGQFDTGQNNENERHRQSLAVENARNATTAEYQNKSLDLQGKTLESTDKMRQRQGDIEAMNALNNWQRTLKMTPAGAASTQNAIIAQAGRHYAQQMEAWKLDNAMASANGKPPPPMPNYADSVNIVTQTLRQANPTPGLPFGVQDPNAGAGTFNLNDLTQDPYER